MVGDSGLDSCRAFTVHYDAEVSTVDDVGTLSDFTLKATDGDKERGTHCDNSEVLVIT